MELNSELAQYIVDYTAKIVDYTINIMNPEAIIIASTDPGRIGEIHRGAKKVLLTGNPYIISEKEAQKYPNVVPGISLPIHFQNSIIGVVGIGAGEQAVTIGRIIQSNTELLIEQFHLRESMNAEEQVRNEFLTHLLSEPWYENEFYFNHQIELHHFEKEQSYLVVSAEVPAELFIGKALNRYDSEIVHYERSISRLLEVLEHRLNYINITIVYLPNMLTFLVPYGTKQQENSETFVRTFISNLDFVLTQTLENDYYIGVGGIARNMTKIHIQYKHAISAIKISKISNPENRICSFADVYFEYQLLSIPKEKQQHYYNKLLGELIREDGENGIWLSTLEAFFRNNQSIGKTAEELFIHRNTLLFRLNRIKQITGLHPQNFKDAITLYVALTFWKLRNFENDSSENTSENM